MLPEEKTLISKALEHAKVVGADNDAEYVGITVMKMCRQK